MSSISINHLLQVEIYLEGIEFILEGMFEKHPQDFQAFMKSETRVSMEFSTGFSGIGCALYFASSNKHHLLLITPHGIGKRAACTITKNQAAIQSHLHILKTELSKVRNYLLKKKSQVADYEQQVKAPTADCITID